MLDWAKAVSSPSRESDKAFEYGWRKLFGGLEVYSFGSIFPKMPPRTISHPAEDGGREGVVPAGCTGATRAVPVSTTSRCSRTTTRSRWRCTCSMTTTGGREARKADFLLLDGWELPAGDSNEATPQVPEDGAISTEGLTGEGRAGCTPRVCSSWTRAT